MIILVFLFISRQNIIFYISCFINNIFFRVCFRRHLAQALEKVTAEEMRALQESIPELSAAQVTKLQARKAATLQRLLETVHVFEGKHARMNGSVTE